VLNIHILRRDPSCFSETRLVWVNIDRRPGKVALLGYAEERGRLRVLGGGVIPVWREHSGKSIVPI